MKILIVSQYYYPEQFQINEVAPELVRRGHSVTVLTGLPNYPKGEIYEGYRNGEKREEVLDGVRTSRVSERPRKRGALNLVWNYYSFVSNASKKALELYDDFDLAFCYQLSPVHQAIPAVKYAKKNNAPLLLYCLDIWPESALGVLKSRKNPIFPFVKRTSKKIYAACDQIAVTSRPFVEYFTEYLDYPREKLTYIPQHADASFLSLDLNAEKSDVVKFMYAGNFGRGQRLDVVIRAVAELKARDDFLVYMVGDGSERERLEKLTDELQVRDKFVFTGVQKRDVMPSWYKKADALLITLRGNNFVGATVPGKLQAYMSCGKPILGAINGGASEIIMEANCGRCVSAGDYRGLADLMRDYIDRPDDFADCGKNARRYFAENFTLAKHVDDLERLMEKTVANYGKAFNERR